MRHLFAAAAGSLLALALMVGSPALAFPGSMNATDGDSLAGDVAFGAGVSWSFVTINSVDTLDGTQYVVSLDASGGDFALTLPAASTTSGRAYVLIVAGASGTVTLTPDGADTIEGAATLALDTQFTIFDVYSDGVSDWAVQAEDGIGFSGDLAGNDLSDSSDNIVTVSDPIEAATIQPATDSTGTIGTIALTYQDMNLENWINSNGTPTIPDVDGLDISAGPLTVAGDGTFIDTIILNDAENLTHKPTIRGDTQAADNAQRFFVDANIFPGFDALFSFGTAGSAWASIYTGAIVIDDVQGGTDSIEPRNDAAGHVGTSTKTFLDMDVATWRNSNGTPTVDDAQGLIVNEILDAHWTLINSTGTNGCTTSNGDLCANDPLQVEGNITANSGRVIQDGAFATLYHDWTPSSPQTITVSDSVTCYQVPLATAGQATGLVADTTGFEIDVPASGYAGVYAISGGLSFQKVAGTSAVLLIHLTINGSSAPCAPAYRTATSTGWGWASTPTCHVALANSDTVEICVQNITNTDNVEVASGTIAAEYSGE